MHACLRGKEAVVQLLIDKGADPQVMDQVPSAYYRITSYEYFLSNHFLSIQKGDACLHFLETLRNQTILECILKEYQRDGVTVDVESLVNTLHTNDIIVIVMITLSPLQSCECSPLSIACKHVAVNSAELLLSYGANPNGCKNVSEANE